MNAMKNLYQTITGQHWGPASIISAVVVLIGAIAGAVMAITNPHLYSFATYQNNLAELAGGTGIVAIGRGLHLGGILSSAGVTPAEEQAALGTITKIVEVMPGGQVARDITTGVHDAESILDAPVAAPLGDGPTVAA